MAKQQQPARSVNQQSKTGIVTETHTKTSSSGHLVYLDDSPWAIWRDVCVRGAGFPAQDILKLAAPTCAAAADALTDAEKTAQDNRDQIRAVLTAQIGLLFRQRRQIEKASQAYYRLNTKLRQLQKAEKHLRRGTPLTESDIVHIPSELVTALQTAEQNSQLCQQKFQHLFEQGSIQVSRAIRKVGQDPRYREAITWQNQQAIHTGVNPLLQMPLGNKQNQKVRRREELLASYMQRYCVKNDSIGFFGPVGWGRIGLKPEAITAEPGADLLAARTVYFEDWCITTLAKSLSQEAFQPWFVPRPMPYLRLEGQILYLPMGNSVQLSMRQAAVLAACNGKRTSHEIAQALMAEPHNDIQNEDDVYIVLQKLCDNRRIVWSFEISTEDAFPEKNLRQLLERIEDVALRKEALQSLHELTAARDAVADAAGNANQLDHALNELNTTFTRLTGVPSTRREGEVYAARTLVYEDCRRDIAVELGSDLIRELETPLKLLCTSARWYTFEVAKRYRVALRKAFREALAQFPGNAGAKTVEFSTFWFWAQPLLGGGGLLPTNVLDTLFQKKWDSILSLPEGQRRVSYSSSSLQSRIHTLFHAPRSGWQLARYHTPDVMLAASSVEDIRHGKYMFVLGEFHIGANGLAASGLFNQHPFPEELVKNYQADLPKPRVISLVSRGETGQTSRTQSVMTSPHDIQIAFSHDSRPQSQSQWMTIGELVVEEIGNELIVRTRNARHRFDIIEVFAHFMSFVVLNNFKIAGQRDYTPRISIDKLVVRRESWRMLPNEAAFAFESEATKRFLRARQWMQRHGMPRFIFVKTPIEAKPIYIDFESPIYVRILAKLIRQTAASNLINPKITISEMYPAHDKLWLADANGERYTSELRLITLDASA